MFKKRDSSNINLDTFTPISRVKELKGQYVPAIINNASYFFVKLQVYEDGLVDVWEMVDLDLFKDKLRTGWVKTGIPDGEDISIHHLGVWEVTQGKWDYDQNSFLKHIKSVIKNLNPEMQNLHNCHGQTTKKTGKINTSILGMGRGKPYVLDGPEYLQRPVMGDDFSIFVKLNHNKYALANLCVFPNDTIKVFGVAKTLTYTLEELKNEISDKRIITELQQGMTVEIYGLGHFIAGACRYAVMVDQLLLDIEDRLKELKGEPTSSELCRELFDLYCEQPTEELREKLKTAYENIPEHLRIYVLGDQDRKDIPVRIAIYGDDEMKKWSHYVLAEKHGQKLPSIKVPKPPKD